MTKTLDLSSYEIVEFKDMSTNYPRKVRGIQLSESLVVSGTADSYKILCLYNGKKIFNLLFINIQDAMKIGEWLDEKFKDYFPILDVYPDMNFFQVVRLSVSGGEEIYNTIKILEKKKRRITLDDFFSTLKRANQHG